MLANRLAVYGKRKNGIPEGTAGLYIRIQQHLGKRRWREKKPMKQLDPPVILIWNHPLLIGCLDLQNGCTLKPTSIVLPITLQYKYMSWF
jgi:nitrogen fixation protein